MNSKRFEKIKENVYTRCSIANQTGIGMTSPDKEELELIDEIDRLNNIINELEKYLIEHIDEYRDMEHDAMFEFGLVLDKLKELKEENK